MFLPEFYRFFCDSLLCARAAFEKPYAAGGPFNSSRSRKKGRGEGFSAYAGYGQGCGSPECRAMLTMSFMSTKKSLGATGVTSQRESHFG